MKKILFFSLMIASFVAFTSCSKDKDAPALGANVKVTVKNLFDIEQESITVYMFEKEVNENTQISESKKQIVTDANGVANFDLNFTELNIIESQTTLYFAVFYRIAGEDRVAGSKGITVERNRSYNVDINIVL